MDYRLLQPAEPCSQVLVQMWISTTNPIPANAHTVTDSCSRVDNLRPPKYELRTPMMQHGDQWNMVIIANTWRSLLDEIEQYCFRN